MFDVAVLPVPRALSEGIDREYLFNFAGLGVKVDVAHKPVGVLGGDHDDDGGGAFPCPIWRLMLKVVGGEDGDIFGVSD